MGECGGDEGLARMRGGDEGSGQAVAFPPQFAV